VVFRTDLSVALTEKSVVTTAFSVRITDKSIRRTIFGRLDHKPNFPLGQPIIFFGVGIKESSENTGNLRISRSFVAVSVYIKQI
jgi:hypothetical protein